MQAVQTEVAPNLRGKRLISSERMAKLALNFVLILAAILCFFPFLWMLSTAIKDPAEVYDWPPVLIPQKIHLENLYVAWNTAPFTRFFLNTTFITIVTMVYVLFSSSTAGFAFAKYDFFGKRVLFFLVLSFLMIPPQVTIIPAYILIRSFGWANTYQGIIVPGLANVFGIFLIRQYMHTVPNELLDAARIDGCSDWRIYWTIIIPLIKPALATLSIFTFTWAWNSFLWPLIVADSERLYTIQLGIAFFTGEGGTTIHLMMAVAFVTLLPVIAMYIAFQKYFVAGISMTGLKG